MASLSSSQQPHKIGNIQSTESMLLNLLSRLDLARQRALNRQRKRFGQHQPISFSMMRYELRTFELWRSVIAECLASFLYVFLLCATHLTWTGSNFIFGTTPNWLIIALCSGFTMATLIQCFGHISGGHVNPSVTIAFLFTKRISPLRAIMYILAHCSGAIAGAALLYGVTVTGNQMHSMGPLGITTGHESLNVWQILTVEFLLTFLVVFTTYATIDLNRKSFGSDSLSIGIAYLVASLTGLPASGASMNPARTLGPAFVMNRWQHHWVYWAGPITGAVIAAIIYEFIFDTRKTLTHLQQYQQQLQHHQQQHNFPQRNLANTGKFFNDHFDFDLERDSNVDDDYEDPELTATNKMTTANHTKLYPGGNGVGVGGVGGTGACSASAASSGSSSGHSRSNHTQHSIVSVHGGPVSSTVPGPFEPYRPMIGPFGSQTTTIQEVSPQIYNEPTNGSNYYQSASDRSANNSGGSNGANASVTGNVQATQPPNSSFFHSMHPDRTRTPGHFVPSHQTMRTSGQGGVPSQPLNRHLNYDHQSVMGSKY